MKLALLVKYLGTPFEGFQAQPSGNTIQQILTSAVSKAVGIPCSVTGCSRTDSGVHANGFVATAEPADSALLCSIWCTVPPEKFHRAVVRYLPDEIAVIGAAFVDDEFHPRYSAEGKEYVYIMKDSPEKDPFLAGRVWHLHRRISGDDIVKMNDACKLLVGEHDFGAFMSSGSSIKDTVRHIYHADVVRTDDTIRFTVSANGFLYNMVRIIVGTLIDSSPEKLCAKISSAIKSGDRSILGITAPPEGLYLNRVFYPEYPDFKCE